MVNVGYLAIIPVQDSHKYSYNVKIYDSLLKESAPLLLRRLLLCAYAFLKIFFWSSLHASQNN